MIWSAAYDAWPDGELRYSASVRATEAWHEGWLAATRSLPRICPGRYQGTPPGEGYSLLDPDRRDEMGGPVLAGPEIQQFRWPAPADLPPVLPRIWPDPKWGEWPELPGWGWYRPYVGPTTGRLYHDFCGGDGCSDPQCRCNDWDEDLDISLMWRPATDEQTVEFWKDRIARGLGQSSCDPT